MKTVIAIIAAIVIVGGGGYALVKHNENKNKSPSTSSTSAYGTTSNQTASNSTNSPSSTPATSSTASAATSAAVTISNFAFDKADVTVKKGAVVTWTNKDSVAHTITETDGQTGPKSSDLNQGQTYSFTYNTVGTFKYHCSIHPNMTGSVTVTD